MEGCNAEKPYGVEGSSGGWRRCVWFFAGITLIAGVSFVDDVVGLGQKVRLLFHLLAVNCAFYLASVFWVYPWWVIVIGYILFIGIVNVYNFMDGINGITG